MAADDPGAARRQSQRDALLIGVALAALALAIVTQAWAWRIDRVLYDVGLTLSPRSAPDDVVIIAIDDASIAAIGRWPWRRAVHTTLLGQLAAARPRAVMLDLVLSEPDPDPRQDALLAQAVRDAAPVVLPLAWATVPGTAPRLLMPAGALRDAAQLAHAEVEPDSDGIVRHTFLHAGIGAPTLPHAAVALLEAGAEPLPALPAVERAPPHTGGRSEAWVRDGRMPVRFQGPAGFLHRVSYVDVLSGAVPAEALRGKYLLIGMTAVGLGDAYATPMVSARGSMPGVEIIGQTLQALRSGDSMRSPPAWLTGALSAAGVLLLLASFTRVRQRVALGLSFALVLLVVVGSVALVGSGWWVSPVGFVPAALLAYPLWSWRRLEVLASALDQEIERLGSDGADAPGAGLPRQAGDLDRRVSAISEATDRLRRARRFLAAGLDGLPEAVLLADASGSVTLANRRAAALFEVEEPSDLAGLSLARLLDELGAGTDIDWPARLRSIVDNHAAIVLQAQLAGHGDFLLHVAPAPSDDGPRLIVTCADVTSILAAERAREEALAFVAHDLRSPVASIQLLADLHQRRTPSLAPDALIAEVKRLAGRALELSEAFVQSAQAQSKPLELADGDLRALLVAALRDVAPQALAREVRLELHTGDAATVSAQFDHELLARAVDNLLTNAIKFSPQRSTVWVGLESSASGHVLTVRDQGAGMDAQQLTRLFRAYSRAGAAPSASGVGLGLQFVRRVADRHAGWVRVDSQPGQGSRFDLFIPSR